jgi:hypothetical protein
VKSSLLVLVAAILTNASAAHAQQSREVLDCTVPVQNGQPTVSLTLSISYESASDFVVVTLNEAGQTTSLFTQMGKGEFDSSLAAGQLGFLLLEEGFSQESGVIRNAGFFLAAKGETGEITGFLSAKGNVYPLACNLR